MPHLPAIRRPVSDTDYEAATRVTDPMFPFFVPLVLSETIQL